jgi:hypothetical protein
MTRREMDRLGWAELDVLLGRATETWTNSLWHGLLGRWLV